MGLMLHSGGEPATLEEISAVPMPKATGSYKPVNHGELVNTIEAIILDTITSLKMDQARFGLRRNGSHLFGHLRFVPKSGDPKGEMGLCIGVVNSYDKTLPVKISAGAEVFVCDNLMLTGDISYARKHTKNVWSEIEAAINHQIGLAEEIYSTVVGDKNQMKHIRIGDTLAFTVLGQLFGNGLLQPNMLSAARKQWEKPIFKQFASRTKWSLYNACNFGLKLSRPTNIMEKHISLHDYFMNGDVWQWRDSDGKLIRN